MTKTDQKLIDIVSVLVSSLDKKWFDYSNEVCGGDDKKLLISVVSDRENYGENETIAKQAFDSAKQHGVDIALRICRRYVANGTTQPIVDVSEATEYRVFERPRKKMRVKVAIPLQAIIDNSKALADLNFQELIQAGIITKIFQVRLDNYKTLLELVARRFAQYHEDQQDFNGKISVDFRNLASVLRHIKDEGMSKMLKKNNIQIRKNFTDFIEFGVDDKYNIYYIGWSDGCKISKALYNFEYEDSSAGNIGSTEFLTDAANYDLEDLSNAAADFLGIGKESLDMSQVLPKRINLEKYFKVFFAHDDIGDGLYQKAKKTVANNVKQVKDIFSTNSMQPQKQETVVKLLENLYEISTAPTTLSMLDFIDRYIYPKPSIKKGFHTQNAGVSSKAYLDNMLVDKTNEIIEGLEFREAYTVEELEEIWVEFKGMFTQKYYQNFKDSIKDQGVKNDFDSVFDHLINNYLYDGLNYDSTKASLEVDLFLSEYMSLMKDRKLMKLDFPGGVNSEFFQQFTDGELESINSIYGAYRAGGVTDMSLKYIVYRYKYSKERSTCQEVYNTLVNHIKTIAPTRSEYKDKWDKYSPSERIGEIYKILDADYRNVKKQENFYKEINKEALSKLNKDEISKYDLCTDFKYIPDNSDFGEVWDEFRSNIAQARLVPQFPEGDITAEVAKSWSENIKEMKKFTKNIGDVLEENEDSVLDFIDNITTLENLYDKILDKTSIQKLVKESMKCLAKYIPDYNIGVEYSSGSINAPVFDIKPLTIKMPYIAVNSDKFAGLMEALEKAIYDALNKAITQTMVNMIKQLFALCSKKNFDFGSGQVDLAGDSPNLMNSNSSLSSIANLLEDFPSDKNKQDLLEFITAVVSSFTSIEFCNILGGTASEDIYQDIIEIARDYDIVSKKLVTLEIVRAFFVNIGTMLPRCVATADSDLGRCDDFVRPSKMSEEDWEKIINDNKELFSQVSQLAENPQQFINNIVDKVLCDNVNTSMVTNSQAYQKNSISAVDTAFRDIYMYFNEEIGEFAENCKRTTKLRKEVDTTIEILDDDEKITKIENPVITHTRSTGLQEIPEYDIIKKQKTYEINYNRALVAPELKDTLRTLEFAEGIYETDKLGEHGAFFKLKTPDINSIIAENINIGGLSGAQGVSETFEQSNYKNFIGEDNWKSLLKGINHLKDAYLPSDLFYAMPYTKSLQKDIKDSYEVTIRYNDPNRGDDVYGEQKLVRADIQNFVQSGKNWLGRGAVGSLDGLQLAYGQKLSQQQIIFAKLLYNISQVAMIKQDEGYGKNTYETNFINTYARKYFPNIIRDFLAFVSNVVADSTLFESVANVGANKKHPFESVANVGADKKQQESFGTETINKKEYTNSVESVLEQLSYDTPNIIDLIKFIGSGNNDCDPPHLLDIDTIKGAIMAQSAGDSCVSLASQPCHSPGAQAQYPTDLHKAIASGCIYAMIRVYAVEMYLRSMFLYSQVKPEEITTEFLINYYEKYIINDLYERFGAEPFDKLLERFLEYAALEFRNLLYEGKAYYTKEIVRGILKTIIDEDNDDINKLYDIIIENGSIQALDTSGIITVVQFEDAIYDFLLANKTIAIKELFLPIWFDVVAIMKGIVATNEIKGIQEKYITEHIPLVQVPSMDDKENKNYSRFYKTLPSTDFTQKDISIVAVYEKLHVSLEQLRIASELISRNREVVDNNSDNLLDGDFIFFIDNTLNTFLQLVLHINELVDTSIDSAVTYEDKTYYEIFKDIIGSMTGIIPNAKKAHEAYQELSMIISMIYESIEKKKETFLQFLQDKNAGISQETIRMLLDINSGNVAIQPKDIFNYAYTITDNRQSFGIDNGQFILEEFLDVDIIGRDKPDENEVYMPIEKDGIYSVSEIIDILKKNADEEDPKKRRHYQKLFSKFEYGVRMSYLIPIESDLGFTQNISKEVSERYRAFSVQESFITPSSYAVNLQPVLDLVDISNLPDEKGYLSVDKTLDYLFGNDFREIYNKAANEFYGTSGRYYSTESTFGNWLSIYYFARIMAPEARSGGAVSMIISYNNEKKGRFFDKDYNHTEEEIRSDIAANELWEDIIQFFADEFSSWNIDLMSLIYEYNIGSAYISFVTNEDSFINIANKEYETKKYFIIPVCVSTKDIFHEANTNREMLSKLSNNSFLQENITKLQQDDTYKLITEYCFPIDNLASFMAIYISETFGKLYNTSDSFASTKEAIMKLFISMTNTSPLEDSGECRLDTQAAFPMSLPCSGLGLGLVMGIPNLGMREEDFRQCFNMNLSMGKVLAKIALQVPKDILKGIVKITDPNVGLAMTIKEIMCLTGKQVSLPLISLLLLPKNVLPFPVGIGPAITVAGFAYLGLAAATDSGFLSKLDNYAKDKLPKSLTNEEEDYLRCKERKDTIEKNRAEIFVDKFTTKTKDRFLTAVDKAIDSGKPSIG